MAEYPLVYGHPRSGTNFVRATIKAALFPNVKKLERNAEIKAGHWAERHTIPATPAFNLGGGHCFYSGQEPAIYVYRDGRDVAASLWRANQLQHPDWRGMDFSDFLRRPLDWRGSPGWQADSRMTIAQHWLAHVRSWTNKRGVSMVAFEDVLESPLSEMRRLAQRFNVDLTEGFEPITTPCAPFAETGQYGGWRDVFLDEDLDYFYSVVPEDYWALRKGASDERGETNDTD